MGENKFTLLAGERIAIFAGQGNQKRRAIEYYYPAWLEGGDWLAAGEKFRSQIVRDNDGHEAHQKKQAAFAGHRR